MNFNFVEFDEDAWLGDGTVTGVHTYDNTIELNDVPIVRQTDTDNSIRFTEDGMIIAKNLEVTGQLITPGFPPQGDGSPLPMNPTFESIITTANAHIRGAVFTPIISVTDTLTVDQKLRLNATSSIVGYQDRPILQELDDGTRVYGPWDFTAADVLFDQIEIFPGGTIGTSDLPNMMKILADEIVMSGTINFQNATVTGLDNPYPSIQETADRIEISKRVKLDSLGRDHIHFSIHESPTFKEIVFQNDERNMLQLIYDVNNDKYQTIDWSHETLINTLKCSHIQGMNNLLHFMGAVDFTDATVTGVGYPSINENAENVVITKPVVTSRLETQDFKCNTLTGAHESMIVVNGDIDFTAATVTGLPTGGYNSITENANDIIMTKPLILNNTASTYIVTNYLTGPENTTLEVLGTIDFSNANVSGIDSSQPYASITENPNEIVMTKPLQLSETITQSLKCNTIQADHENTLAFAGTVDFTNATVTGLGGTYPSIEETESYISFAKDINMGLNTLVTQFIGTTDSGIQLEHGAKRINFMLDDMNMAWSIMTNTSNGTTTTIDYAQTTLVNHVMPHTISPRPGYNKIDFQGIVDFSDATVSGYLPGFHYNAGSSSFDIDPGKELMFIKSSSNSDIGTEINDKKVITQAVGRSNTEWVFEEVGPNGTPQCRHIIDDDTIFALNDLFVACNRPFHAIKNDSSGNFTHCHLTEGSQSTIWQTGRVVTSTGEYYARDNDGILITDPTAAPDISYAMCKIDYAVKGDKPLGIIASVETVANNTIYHAHGGITLVTKIEENDGHNMVRVAASGDIMAWVVEGLFTEIDIPPLSGLWQKCVDNNGYYGGHTVLSNHVGFEADGYLMVDNQIIDTNTANVQLNANEIIVYPPEPTLTPSLFSGVYNKTINGITQPIQIVMHCNHDYSFSFSEHFPSFEQRVAALEATIAELTGPD